MYVALLIAFNWILVFLASEADHKTVVLSIILRNDHPTADRVRALEQRISDARRVRNILAGGIIAIDTLFTAGCAVLIVRRYKQRNREGTKPRISN